MRFSMILVLALMAPSAFAQNKPAHAKKSKVAAEVIQLDTLASKIDWVGKKVSGEHKGTVMFKEGHFDIKDNTIASGEVVIDLNTITNSDLADADYNKKLVGHLKSEDFFNVEKFPTASFKITKFTESHNFAPGDTNAVAKGTLTIRGVSKPAEVKLFYTPKDGGFEAKGKMEVDRTQFGVKYNSKKFFSAAKLGDKMINDKFDLDLTIVASKAIIPPSGEKGSAEAPAKKK